MRAVVINEENPSNSPYIAEVPKPELQDGELLVKIAYGGMNSADWKHAAGLMWDYLKRGFPCILGWEGSGTVTAVGQGVSGFRVGDRVMFGRGAHQQGAFAEYVAVPATQSFLVPDGIALHEAATIPVCFMTSYLSLFASHLGSLKPGQKVLIHGGSGGVGSFAIQLAKFGGVSVAATGRSANGAYLADLGADYVIDYTDPDRDIVTNVRQWAPEGVDVIMDGVGMGTLANPLEALKPGGTLVSIATATHDGGFEAESREAERRGFRHVFAIANAAKDVGKFPLAQVLRDGGIRVPPVEVFDIDNVRDALAKLKEGHVRGKIALRIGGEE